MSEVKTKKIELTVTYTADVPEDMELDMVKELADFETDSHFSIHVTEYSGDNELKDIIFFHSDNNIEECEQ